MATNDKTGKAEDGRGPAGTPSTPNEERRATSDDTAPDLMERKCYNCAYSRWLCPGLSRLLTRIRGCLLLCTNHAADEGEPREVWPGSVCPNFRFRRRPVDRVEPPEPNRPGVKHIALTRGKFAIVDAEDFDRLNQWKWTAYYTCGKWYAGRNEHGRCILMHRQIMNPPKGKVVDHKNRNGLDNTRENLRIGTYGQNNCNRRPRGKTSQYKGVTYDKKRNKYRATAWKDGKSIHVGRYDDEIEAALAADRKNYELNGEFAYLNFPDVIHRELAEKAAAIQDTEKEKPPSKGDGKRKKAQGKEPRATRKVRQAKGRK